MQKKPLEISCYVLGAGAFGVFVRWLQDQLAFDEAGLVEASAFNFLVPALLSASFFMFRSFIKQIKSSRLYVPDDFCEALFNPGKLFAVARWAIGLIMCLAAALLLIESETDVNVEFHRVLCVLAFLSGISFPFVLSNANYEDMGNVKLLRLGMLMPILLYGAWLVLSYKQNSLNSVIWSYIIEMATLMMAMVAFFRIAGYAYYVPNQNKCLISIMMGAAMCVMSLADERYMGLELILFSSALMLVLYNWILFANLRSRKPKPKRDEDNYDEGGFEQIR